MPFESWTFMKFLSLKQLSQRVHAFRWTKIYTLMRKKLNWKLEIVLSSVRTNWNSWTVKVQKCKLTDAGPAKDLEKPSADVGSGFSWFFLSLKVSGYIEIL